jgi:3-deoxy-D-manno-octulosonic-acid transferase
MNRIVLFFYNLLFFPLLLVLLPGYLLRMVHRGGYQNKAKQRFGFFDQETLARIGRGRIWIHAASVGEVGIALKFIAEYKRQNPDTRFILSITTSTGLVIAEKQGSEFLEIIANPLDFPFLTNRLVRKVHPAALLFVEADLWPNRIAAARKLGIPVILINARLSVRSEQRFRIVKQITAPFFNSLNLIILTEAGDRERWLSIGVQAELLHLAGNIKYDTARPAQTNIPILLKALGWNSEDPLFLAASTHEGEEIEIVRAFQIARQNIPSLRLVIAPRHVERRAEIVKALKPLGLSVSLRSEGIGQSSDLLLLDTTGELSRWYPLAILVFVGKSLPCSMNHGGQNMIEPLQAGRPVLIGQHTSNFEPLATRLCEAGAAIRVTDAADIAQSIEHLLKEPSQREAMLHSAHSVLAPHQGATERSCHLVADMQ